MSFSSFLPTIIFSSFPIIFLYLIFCAKIQKLTISAKYSILYSAEIMLFYTLSARYRLLFIAALLPSLTITMPPSRRLYAAGWPSRNLSLQNLSFPYPIFQYLLQIIRRKHPQLLSDIATLGSNIGFCLIEQDTDFCQLLVLQDEVTDFPF